MFVRLYMEIHLNVKCMHELRDFVASVVKSISICEMQIQISCIKCAILFEQNLYTFLRF